MESIGNIRLTKYIPAEMGGSIPPMGGRGPAAGTPYMQDVPGAPPKPGKESTPMHRYPLGVDTDEDQGHYMIFEVMQTNPAKLISRKFTADAIKAYKKAKAEYNTNTNDLVMTGEFEAAAAAEKFGNTFMANMSVKQSGPNSLQVKTPATADMVEMAALYMPPSVQVTYGANCYGRIS
jgi:hypothetical protein